MTMEKAQLRNYAMRRVNPFLGVLQIVETTGGRAISANGVVWDIEVLTEYNDGWGNIHTHPDQQAYYRYGLWSQEQGLVSRPLAAQFDSGILEEKADDLIQAVSECLDQLPFRLEDHFELWLFDENDEQPIALLASCRDDSQRPTPEPQYWKASLGDNGVASQHRFPGASDLEASVKKRAGLNINKHWVIRDDDGAGQIEGTATQLDTDVFPACLLIEQWQEPEQEKLASDYLEWVAPSLLTLQQITKEQRRKLETCLGVQAISVEHHWRLFPDVLDEEGLKAARVKCRLQKSNYV